MGIAVLTCALFALVLVLWAGWDAWWNRRKL